MSRNATLLHPGPPHTSGGSVVASMVVAGSVVGSVDDMTPVVGSKDGTFVVIGSVGSTRGSPPNTAACYAKIQAAVTLNIVLALAQTSLVVRPDQL